MPIVPLVGKELLIVLRFPFSIFNFPLRKLGSFLRFLHFLRDIKYNLWNLCEISKHSFH